MGSLGLFHPTYRRAPTYNWGEVHLVYSTYSIYAINQLTWKYHKNTWMCSQKFEHQTTSYIKYNLNLNSQTF